MTSKTLTDLVLERISNLDVALCEDFDISLDAQIKRCFADYVGVSIAGAELKADCIRDYCGFIGHGDSYVVGSDVFCDAQNAAFLMGLQAHATELDDGHRKGMVHPGAVVFSALLAINPYVHASWSSFRRAAVLGYETTILLSELVQPFHKKSGFHATATCGAAGAACAAAALLGQNLEGWKTAISIALSGANGLLETINTESDLKPINAARAAMLGVNAAVLSACSFRVPHDIVGGERGFASCMASNLDLSSFPVFEATPFIMGVYFKPYSSCRHCHPGVEAAIKISGYPAVTFERLRAVKIETYELALKGHCSKDLSSASAAKMSIPVSVALALATGRGDCFDDDLLTSPVLERVVNATCVSACDELSRLVPAKRVAIVTAILDDGSTISERVDYPKGEPENPMSNQELKEKFARCSSSFWLSSDRAEICFDSIMDMSPEQLIDDFLEMMRG